MDARTQELLSEITTSLIDVAINAIQELVVRAFDGDKAAWVAIADKIPTDLKAAALFSHERARLEAMHRDDDNVDTEASPMHETRRIT